MKIIPCFLSNFGLALLGGMILAGSAHAQIVANFTDGNGTALVDQYAGKSGAGWTGAWYTVNNTGTGSSTKIAATVVTTSPLNGGGNYLSVTNTDTATSNSAGDIVGRDISSANGVDLSAAYKISFDFRLDTPASELGSSDGITIVNDSSGSKVLGGGNGFGLYGNSSGWQVRNGASFSSTGMALTTGLVYSFTITLAPSSHQYQVSIFNGTDTYTSSTLGYRNTSVAGTGFTHLLFDSKDFAGLQTITYSLDNISVAAIPEPSAFSAAVGGAFLVLAGIRRRR